MKTSTIMNQAWMIRRNAAARFGCKISEIHMGECLRMAWTQSRRPAPRDTFAEDVTLMVAEEYARRHNMTASLRGDRLTRLMDEDYNVEIVTLGDMLPGGWSAIAALCEPQYHI